MKTNGFKLLCAAIAALALVAAFSSCKKDDPQEKPALDFKKLDLEGSEWQVTTYSATLADSHGSMWSSGGDGEISDML